MPKCRDNKFYGSSLIDHLLNHSGQPLPSDPCWSVGSFIQPLFGFCRANKLFQKTVTGIWTNKKSIMTSPSYKYLRIVGVNRELGGFWYRRPLWKEGRQILVFKKGFLTMILPILLLSWICDHRCFSKVWARMNGWELKDTGSVSPFSFHESNRNFGRALPRSTRRSDLILLTKYEFIFLTGKGFIKTSSRS